MSTSISSQISGILQSLAIKAPVHAVSTGPLTLSGLQVVGGIALDGNTVYRVLVKDQPNPIDNGLYDASSNDWVRSTDFDGVRDVVKGTLIPRNVGDSGVYFRVTTANPVVPGTSAITFEAVSETLSQDDLTLIGIGSTGISYDQTPAELAASVVPLQKFWPSGEVPRYMDAGQLADWLAGTGLVDQLSALQAALTVANYGGPRVHAPAGNYLCSSNFNIFKNTLFYGDGWQATNITFTHVGDGINSTWPINSSTAVNITVRDMSLINTNVSNAGGGFVDVGGSYVKLRDVRISGFAYSAIFDQTEVSEATGNIFNGYSVAGVWMVSGADHTMGASANFTNRITIEKNQFNTAGASAIGIQDDGGAAHSYENNNINGGSISARLAGVFGLNWKNNYTEAATGLDMWLTNTTVAGATVSGCTSIDIGGGSVFNSSGVSRNIQLDAADGGKIVGNFFGQAANGINLGNNAAGVLIEGNSRGTQGAARVGGLLINGTAAQFRANIIRQAESTYVALAVGSTGSQTVTPASMLFIFPGTHLAVRNADNTNSENIIVTAVTGTTFTAVFASTKAANWVVVGSTPYDQQEGTWTPTIAGSSTAGSNTYGSTTAGKWQRRGNLTIASFNIDVTTVDGSMAGALQINGLPFASENQSNQNDLCYVSLFTGFTFSAGFTAMGGYVAPNSSVILLRKSGSGVALTTVPASDIAGSTCSVYGTIIYSTKDS